MRLRHSAVGERDCVRLLAGARLLPFVEDVRRHKAAPSFDRFAESRLALDPFRLGAKLAKLTLMSLAQ